MARVCRNCAFCHWREQYCGARDSDMSKSFMMHNTGCSDHMYEHELEDYEYELEAEEL